MSELIITCPNCKTRYSADPTSIGDQGRNVRCARCETTWFVEPPQTPESLASERLALRDLESATRSDLDEPPTPTAPAPDVDPVDAPKTSPEPPRASPVEHVGIAKVGADVIMRDQADRAKLAARRRTLVVIWLVPLVLVIVAAVLAITNRQSIVNRYPQAATLYQALGMTVRIGGLEIDPPRATSALVDGTPVVRVEGTVRNLTGQTRPVPLIELSLDDDRGTSLAQWYVEPSQPTLPGRGTLTIQTEYANPPAEATGLSYRFASDPF